MDKQGNLHLNPGMIIRLLASLVIISSLPFLILNITNVIAQITFGFGNFLMILGGALD